MSIGHCADGAKSFLLARLPGARRMKVIQQINRWLRSLALAQQFEEGLGETASLQLHRKPCVERTPFSHATCSTYDLSARPLPGSLVEGLLRVQMSPSMRPANLWTPRRLLSADASCMPHTMGCLRPPVHRPDGILWKVVQMQPNPIPT